MRSLTLGEQLEQLARDMEQDVSPFSVIDRDIDHCPIREVFLPGPDAIRVQELNETIAREVR